MSHLEFGSKVIVFLVARRAGHATVPLSFLNPKPVVPPCAALFRDQIKKREGRGREEKRRETRARLRRSSPFLSKNWLGLLSSFRFPHLHGFSSLFMVVPPCVVQLGSSRRITVMLAAKQMVGNRCWDRRQRRCLCCLQGKNLGETCSCCRTYFPSDFRGF